MIWAVIGAWFLGAVITLRITTLKMKDKYQRRLSRGFRPDWSDYAWGIACMTAVWPGVWLFVIGWKLAFPRGVETRYDREQKLQAALSKAERESTAREQRIKELETQVLAWTPVSNREDQS